ncbi:MAG: sigma-54 dependent transcriptional regulator [Proteobacteria bacterium]|nr:sigma-54 dependent transcriptional regulator [Pseudomonadota bacterium]MBU1649756.1 sigma-54 dependent transcriptional regulator [Pseudomonadota bacterium]
MQAPFTILLADNDLEKTDILSEQVKNNKAFDCRQYKTEKELFSILSHSLPQLLIYDLTLPGIESRLTLLQKIHQDYPELLIIAVIPDGAEDLIELILQLDLFFYIHKPYDPAEIRIALKRAQSILSRRTPNSAPITRGKQAESFYGLIGQNERMQLLFELITKVAEDEFATVLIRGESGTGKELVAKAIHTHSKRNKKHFVPVNCAAIPDDLLESELFGYTKGAFTGATQNKIGRIEYANGGTLFLDEIGDMKPSLQAKLLRVLQEKEFEPVGGLKACPVDTRIVAATHCDLEQLVSEGRFREDLYYRLSVIPLSIPPLKERRDDIPLLLESFIQTYSTKRGRAPLTFEPMVIKALMNYEWRGNVRELENLVQHMSILFSGKNVRLEDLPEKFTVDFDPSSTVDPLPSSATVTPQQTEDEAMIQPTPDSDISWESGQVDFNELINDFERQLIIRAMKISSGNKKEAARLLNLKRTTLLEKIKKKEIEDSWE